jgi:hypothetical protein
MAYQEWAEADYSRIYHTLLDDPKFASVYDDDARWAWYTRLLIAADSAYPAPAPLPRGLPDDVLHDFTELAILIVIRGSHYRVKALQSEREGRATGRAAGGRARVAGAQRDEHGRFLAGEDAGHAGDAGANAGSSKPPAPAGPASPAKPSRGRDERISSERDSSGARARPRRADIEALHERGWKRVTKAQRKVLDEVLDRHDVTGPEFAAEVIRATPAGRDPLDEVMKADRRWQDAQRRRVEAEEAAWAKEKAVEAAATPEEPLWMGEPVGGLHSSTAQPEQGPHGSHVSGRTGSKIEGPTS